MLLWILLIFFIMNGIWQILPMVVVLILYLQLCCKIKHFIFEIKVSCDSSGLLLQKAARLIQVVKSNSRSLYNAVQIKPNFCSVMKSIRGSLTYYKALKNFATPLEFRTLITTLIKFHTVFYPVGAN